MTIDEFKQCDLRVGKVLAAEHVEGSEKLLKLQIDLGETSEGDDGASEPMPRQILSGIAKAYAPEDLVGKQVVIIANLEPRMMMGFESRGMLLAASGADGKPVILTAAAEVASGTKIT
jgi:methionine--tRNA ligase beta chain